MLAENYCYSRQNVLIRELARRGDLGDCYYAEGEYLHDVKELHHHPDGARSWGAPWQVGRNGCAYCTHSLGPIMQWLGPGERIATVSCLGTGVHTDPEHAMEDSVLMLCKLASGRLVRVRLDMLSNRPHAMTNYTLQGTAGCYESSRAAGERDRIWLARFGETRWHDIAELDEDLPGWYREGLEAGAGSGHSGGDFFTAREFVRACRGEIAVPIPVEDAVAWTAAWLCSQESITRGGMPIPLPCLESAPPGRGLSPETLNRPLGPQLVMRAPATLPPPELSLPEGYTLRLAGPRDAGAVARCMTLAFGDWDEEKVRTAFLEAPDCQATFVAVDVASGAVAAVASHREVPDRFPGATYLHWVGGDPAHAGRGLGAAVSAAVLSYGRRRGLRDAVLETDDHRLPAIATYLRLGFAPEYRDPSHPPRWAAVFHHLAEGRRARSQR
jgi:ribosomal protein S18 acetylase RimI-like enzyme